ncbi:hypothetical protein BCON_0050g00440 [Botryotinia convoluta]|uniref:Uncharacterized protein n=1 Tax=Botryotinia convoluta TaxID=54673 RepID=A0A4Z1IH46_9HELO|nr:hypothetical protein BCON_0050g00440 [Botryotinia convoluta]
METEGREERSNPHSSQGNHKSKQNCPLFSACRNLFADLGCLPTRRDTDPLDECSSISVEYSLSICPMTSISIPDIARTGDPVSMTSIPDVGGIGNPVPMTSIPDVAGIGNPVSMGCIPDVTWTGNPALIENNDNNNTLNATNQAERETDQFEGLCLAQRLRLIEQRYIQLEAPHDSSMSVASCSLPPLPPGNFTFSFPTAVPTTVKTTVDESNLQPTDDEQPSFPYTIYDFTKFGLVVSEISGINVEEQYHNIMEIIGEACGKCPKCTSDNRVQDLIDTIIEIRFPDLDTALFRDGILSEFGFDDYWNELIVAKPEVRRGYVKYEKWYAKVWENIEANNDLPAISKAIEKEFCRSRDFKRILAGKQRPTCKWRKMELLLFVMRMRRIRGKLEERPQTQEKQETQTIETTAKKNRKTRDKEKRRKLRDREDKVAAKLLHDTLEEIKRMAVEANVRNIMMARRDSTTSFAKVCTPEGVYSGWEKTSAFLPFINIQEFDSLIKGC